MSAAHRLPTPPAPLTQREVIDGYSAGLFLWPFGEGRRNWFLPEIRTLFPIEGMHISRSLSRRIRKGEFEIRFDTDLPGVFAGCARPQGTWITSELRKTYTEMWPVGVHSIEAWDEEGLAGGLYGLGLGGVFFAESMFHYRTDAGKVALAAAIEHCRDLGFRLFDVQLTTEHLLTLGAYEVSAAEFFRQAGEAFETTTPWSYGASTTPSLSEIEAFSERYSCAVYIA